MLDNRRNKQVASLYGSLLAGLFVGIAVSVINTRLLGPERFGDLKFLQTLFTFSVTFITFGIFVSGSRILAQKTNEPVRHEIMGSLLGFAALSSIALSVLLFAFSFVEERIFDNDLAALIRIFSPFLFIYPFQLCLENIYQGDNRIYGLSVFRILPQVLYIIFVGAINFLIPLSLTSALAIQFGVFALTIIGMSILLKPKLGDINKNLALIWNENRNYGFHVYVGAIAGVATGQLGGIAVGYFVNNTNVGYYSLALALTLPLSMIPNAFGTTFFKEFANSALISSKVTAATFGLSCIALASFLLVAKPIILLLYSEDFIDVVPLTYIMAVAAIFYGFGDFVNRFLGAHGRGVELRNGAILVGITNILGFTILVNYFGITGAAMTRLCSGIVYFLAMLAYYRRYVRDQGYQTDAD